VVPALVAVAPAPAAELEKDLQLVEKDLQTVEEVLGVQTLLLGLVAASALRVTSALGRDKREEGTVAPGGTQLTVTGARVAAVNITPTRASSEALLQQLFAESVDPEAPVSSIMTARVLTAKASDSVESLVAQGVFDAVTGVVVVADDAPLTVVGIFSRRDAAKARSKDPVRTWMTSPALTIEGSTSILECAALMLKHEVHRLPVSSSGQLAGIVTRTDVFNALLSKYKGAEECVPPP